MANHIFVVDDDAANLRVAGHILRKNEMDVTALNSGKALLDAIVTDALPSLILLDIKMPEMDGFETLHQLRKKEKALGIAEIPVIFLTADETADTEKLGFEAGVSDYIRKPFDPDILLRRVHNILSKEQRITTLRTEADTDQLTGFLNKAAACRVMSGLCSSEMGCLLMIDLDSFKLVNDLYGHKMGDHVLIAFAEILRSELPQGSQIGRIGGDEFSAFLIGMQTPESLTALTKRINDALAERAKKLMGADLDIPLGASVGGVFVPQSGDDFDMLFRMADKALYTVKKNGKHGFSLYQEEDSEADAGMRSINKLSEILGERSIPNVALQLDKDAFSYVYRYIMRYMLRNQQCLYKVLFTLHAADGADDRSYKENCDLFGNHICESLRKTDILMRSRFNQFFVLLTDIREHDIETVLHNIMHRWERSGGSGLKVTTETEFVSMPVQRRHQAEIRIALAAADETELRQTGTLLSKAGFRVSAMRTGRALLKYLNENKPELILLDAELSEPDCFAVLEQLQGMQNAANIPKVLLHAFGNSDAESRAVSLGAEDVIYKQCAPELLIHRIRRITELADLRRDPRFSRRG